MIRISRGCFEWRYFLLLLEIDVCFKLYLKYREIYVYLNLCYFYDVLFIDYYFVLCMYLYVFVVYIKYMYNVEKSIYFLEIIKFL